MVKFVPKVGLLLLVFILGTLWGLSMTPTEKTESREENAIKIGGLDHTIITPIKFADEDKRKFIEEHAQFSISPNGEITSIDGKKSVLLIQHDKEDWDWYNAVFITDEDVLQKCQVPYGKHRKTGLPAESIFDKSQ
jgi:hypothetical protein